MWTRILISDWVIIVSANVVNLLVALVFVARARKRELLEWWLGLFVVLMGAPVLLAALWNLSRGREAWTVYLPGILIAYLVAEFVLDYWLKISFRSNVLLWPYIVLFYAGQIAMISYASLIKRQLGLVTLATYFVSLGATWWANRQTRTS